LNSVEISEVLIDHGFSFALSPLRLLGCSLAPPLFLAAGHQLDIYSPPNS
jgi:hypothetical protein